jgi:chromosome segregation ATPase
MTQVIQEAGEYRARAETAEREVARLQRDLEAAQGRLRERERVLAVDREALRRVTREAATLRQDMEQRCAQAAEEARQRMAGELDGWARRYEADTGELRAELAAARDEVRAAVELAESEEAARIAAETEAATAWETVRRCEEERLALVTAETEAELGVGPAVLRRHQRRR